jgi:glycosyltransferase involved in cell wall biosynthesis
MRNFGNLAAPLLVAAGGAAAVASATIALDRPARRPQAEARKAGRLWILNQYAVTPDAPGITRHYELGTLLAAQGWGVDIFATGFNHNLAAYTRDVRPWRWRSLQEREGVRYHWLYSTPYRRNDWRRYANMLSFTTAATAGGLTAAPRPDVVIGSSPHLLTGLAARMLARRHDAPFILEVRDMWPDMLDQLGLARSVVAPLAKLEAYLYAESARVLALTEGIKARILDKGVPEAKVAVVANSALKPAPLDEARRRQRRCELGWEGKCVLVWAGSHNPMNGLDVVVEAARLLQSNPDVLVVFIGDGSLKQDLVVQARGLPNIRFYEPLPRSEIQDFLRAADIGLLHSRSFDAFTGARPNKLFEYMSAGLPILTTVPGEAWEIVREAAAGIHAEWENSRALAAAVVELAGQPDNRQAMGVRGHEFVTNNHSRERTADDLAVLLREVIDQHARRRGR